MIGFTKMDLRDSTSMRNYELIKQIYKMASDYPYPIAIKKLIEKQRPELKKDNLNAADSPTFESKMEEMRKYPHQDNHMD